jgi:hypothetical protein
MLTQDTPSPKPMQGPQPFHTIHLRTPEVHGHKVLQLVLCIDTGHDKLK